jgi:hypothetical protein
MNRKSKSTTQTGVTTGVRKLSKQHRDDDTMSKLNQFKTKMFQAKGFKKGAGNQQNGNGSRNGNGNHNRNGNESSRHTVGGDSLATRMARKDKAANEKKLPFEHAPVYSGFCFTGPPPPPGPSFWLSSVCTVPSLMLIFRMCSA